MLQPVNSAWTVAVQPFSESTLVYSCSTPCVLCVNVDTKYFGARVDHGFRNDVGHSVVCPGRSGGNRVAVFDPSPDFGVEDWDQDIFQAVTNGVVLQLVPRDSTSRRSDKVTERMERRFPGGNLTARL